jgi:hypothetical protein
MRNGRCICAIAALSLASAVRGEQSAEATYVQFGFAANTLLARQQPKDTETCIAKELVNTLNSNLANRSILKYWKFKEDRPKDSPALQVQILSNGSGWELEIGVNDSGSNAPEPPPVVVPLFQSGEETVMPRGCKALSALIAKVLVRVINDRDGKAALETVLHAVPIAGKIDLESKPHLATIPLAVAADPSVMNHRKFKISVRDPNQALEFRSCATGKRVDPGVQVQIVHSEQANLYVGPPVKSGTKPLIFLTKDNCEDPNVSRAGNKP